MVVAGALLGGLAIAGTAVSIAAAVRQGQIEQANADLQRDVARRNAEQQALSLEREAAILTTEADREAEARAVDTESRRKFFGRQFAAREAAVFAGGIEFEGSPLLVAMDEAREAELAIRQEERASEFRELGLREEADVLAFEAAEARRTGQFQMGLARREKGFARERMFFNIAGATLQGGSTVAGIQGRRTLGGTTTNV